MAFTTFLSFYKLAVILKNEITHDNLTTNPFIVGGHSRVLALDYASMKDRSHARGKE